MAEEKPKRVRTKAEIEAQKRYYQRHKEECLARQRKWFAEHPDYQKEYGKAYRKSNSDKWAKTRNSYYQKHREERLIYQRAYEKLKRERIKREKGKTGMIIGLTGNMQAGKDTVMEFISTSKGDNYCVKHTSCAGGLKRLCHTILGLSNYELFTQEGKAAYNHKWGMTNREILQKIGTDALRNNFHKDIWVILLKDDILNMAEWMETGYGSKYIIVVPDIRFDNEAKLIHDLGGYIWEVARPGYEGDGHASEQGVSVSFIDDVINNDGSLDDLKNKVEKLLQERGI
jgi:hypothetical protein